MKFLLASFAAVAVLATSAMAQVPVSGNQQKPPAQHQPGTPAQPGNPLADAVPLPLEKPDPAKDAAVRHLMDITQTNKMGDNIAAAITNQVRQVMSRAIQPDRLPQFMDAFSQKLNASAPSSAVTDAVVPIYARRFTTEDIEGLIRFYESPLGRKVVSAMPQVTQESETAGIQIDQKAAMDVLRGMQNEYPELKPMLPPENGAPAGANQPSPVSPPKLAPAPPQK